MVDLIWWSLCDKGVCVTMQSFLCNSFTWIAVLRSGFAEWVGKIFWKKYLIIITNKIHSSNGNLLLAWWLNLYFRRGQPSMHIYMSHFIFSQHHQYHSHFNKPFKVAWLRIIDTKNWRIVLILWCFTEPWNCKQILNKGTTFTKEMQDVTWPWNSEKKIEPTTTFV